jgi:ABC-type protease/lipase transport system fused ATPase/permease subunit
LFLQEVLQFITSTLKYHRHFAQSLVIIVGANFFLTDPRAAANAVIQASTILMQRPWSLTQWEDTLNKEKRAAQQSYINIRSIEAI